MAAEGLPEGSYVEAIGLRADEGTRLLRMAAGNVENDRRCVAPLADAGIRRADVMTFWNDQPFDLGLEPWEGNCDVCFLKGKGIRKRIIRDNPRAADWWRGQELAQDATFDSRISVARLVAEVRAQPAFEFFDTSDPDDEHDAECGTWCVGEAA